jgi:hypothetical protein
MIISSVLHRIFNNSNNKKNLAWTPCDNSIFESFIRESCNPCELIQFDNIYFGYNDIDIVICNNRMLYLDKCIELCYFLHCPLLIIDHTIKSSIINKETPFYYGFEPVYQIALTNKIYESWGGIHDKVLDYDINHDKSKQIWKNMIFQLGILNFKIKTLRLNDVEKNQIKFRETVFKQE